MIGKARACRREQERGQAVVELAIVVSLMLIMTVSLFDLGRGMLVYLAVINGARDGARVAMDTGATDTTIAAAALSAAAPYRPTVNITRSGSDVSVTVSYPYEPMTPFLMLVGNGGNLYMSSRMVSR